MRWTRVALLLGASAGAGIGAGAAPAAAQPARRLEFVRDTAIDLAGAGVRGPATALVRRDGRVLAAASYLRGAVIALDSFGRKLPWTMPLGRGSESDVSWVSHWGWVGDSLWVMDPYYRQIAIVGADGRVARSIRFPSWVRPFWRDRRKYPLFSQMTWHAAYDDGTMLVEPSQPRRLLDTPGYDGSRKLLVRIDADGRVLRTVASVPAMDGRMQLRSGTERRWVTVPNYPRAMIKVATDGRRIGVVEPLAEDSGAFRVTLLTGGGDTVFTRRYVTEAVRVDRARLDSALGRIVPLGRYTAEQIRDTILRQVAAFHSPVAGLELGLDYSVWVWIRRPTSNVQDAEWLVLDERGEPLGVALLPRTLKLVGRSTNRLWAIENDRVKQRSTLVLFRRADVRGARPVRSGRGTASSSPARPRE